MQEKADRDRYIQIGSYFLDNVPPLLRKHLKQKYESEETKFKSLKDFLESQSVRHVLFHLRYNNSRCCIDSEHCITRTFCPINAHQWQRLYKLADTNTHPNHQKCHCNFTSEDILLDEIDIPLASVILYNCFKLDLKEETAIQSLRRLWNENYAHNYSGRISEQEFITLRQNLKQCVLQLDSSQQNDLEIFETYQHKLLDEIVYERCQSTVQEMFFHVMEAKSKIEELGLVLVDKKHKHDSSVEDNETETIFGLCKPNKRLKGDVECVQNSTNCSVSEQERDMDYSMNPNLQQLAVGQHTDNDIQLMNFDFKISLHDQDMKEVAEKVTNIYENVKNTLHEITKKMKNNTIIRLKILEVKLDFDSFFQSILQDIDSRIVKAKTITNELEKLPIKFQMLEKKIGDSSNPLSRIHIENRVKKDEEHFQKLRRDSGKIPFNLDENKIKGSIDSIYKKLIVENGLQVQTLSRENIIDADNVQLQKVTTFELPKGEKEIQIRGCAILSKKEVCFADRGNNRLIFMTNKGFHKLLPLPCQPTDITVIQGNKLAVSLNEKNIVQIINTENMSQENLPVKIDSGVNGLTYHQDLIVLRTGKGYSFVTSKGETIRNVKISGTKMPYVACSENRIYFAKWEQNEIHCCDFSGKTLWVYQNESMIKYPNGVSTDKDGNVYVAGSRSNNVVVISSDGTKCKEILNEQTFPVAIDLDKDSKRLLICSSNSNAVLYSLL